MLCFQFLPAGRPIIVIVIVVFATMSQAALPPSQGEATPFADELIVFETETCVHCKKFRQDILPRYRLASKVRHLPIIFVNLKQDKGRRAQLKAPVTMVPTFVLVRRGREVGRIAGYTGTSYFFLLLQKILLKAE